MCSKCSYSLGDLPARTRLLSQTFAIQEEDFLCSREVENPILKQVSRGCFVPYDFPGHPNLRIHKPCYPVTVLIQTDSWPLKSTPPRPLPLKSPQPLAKLDLAVTGAYLQDGLSGDGFFYSSCLPSVPLHSVPHDKCRGLHGGEPY